MKMRRVTSVFAAVVMVFSLFSAIGINPSVSDAKVTSSLPKTAGLYAINDIPVKWDDQQNKDVVLTDKDQNGNTVLVDFDGNFVPYCDQDNPEYLTKGIEEGWGPWVNPVECLWFDYVDGNKITHVPASKLKVTHLDGSACDEVKLSAHESDSRVVLLKSSVAEPVLLTYTGAKKNNKMILMVNLMPNFYTTDTRTVDGYVSDEIKTVEGKTKDIYVHLSNNYDEEAKYIVDPANALTVRYWDDTQDKDVELSGQDAAEFASVSVVSDKDPHNMSYKVTLKGKRPSSNNAHLDLNFKYKEYFGDDNNSAEDRECFASVSVIKGNKLYAASGSAFVIKNGKPAVVDTYRFYGMGVLSSTYETPLYMSFLHTDDEGKNSYVDDPNDLTFYMNTYDEATKTEGVGDKLPDEYKNLIQITPDPSAHVLKFVVPTIPDMDRFIVVVGYKDEKPDPESCLRIEVRGGNNTLEGFHSSSATTNKTYISEVSTDGTKPLTVYLAGGKPDWVKSVKFNSLSIIDENGKDLGKKVKIKDTTVTKAEYGNWDIGKAITIPAGTLSSGVVMHAVLECEGEDGHLHNNDFSLMVFYTAPKKGTKFTSGGVTYKVTGKNAVSVSKVKASAKSVTIPAAVGALKVTGIAAKAMKGCKKLTKITVKSTAIKSVGKGAFTGVPAKATASVPKAKKAAYAKLFKKGGFKGKVK